MSCNVYWKDGIYSNSSNHLNRKKGSFNRRFNTDLLPKRQKVVCVMCVSGAGSSVKQKQSKVRLLCPNADFIWLLSVVIKSVYCMHNWVDTTFHSNTAIHDCFKTGIENMWAHMSILCREHGVWKAEIPFGRVRGQSNAVDWFGLPSGWTSDSHMHVFMYWVYMHYSNLLTVKPMFTSSRSIICNYLHLTHHI